MTITLEYAQEVFDYNPETGKLFWKQRHVSHFRVGVKYSALRNSKIWNTRYAGNPAGRVLSNGYIGCKVGGREELAHRIIWLLHTGRWPSEQIDHINRVKDDNRIANLREATRSQNKANVGLSKGNTSGIKGVYWVHGKWRARITKNGKMITIGSFGDRAEAARAYEMKAKELFGDFARSP